MKILVDADACPVKDIIEEVAESFNIPVIMIIDTSHELHREYSTVVQVSKGKDAVDVALFNRCEAGDIAVTGDYGVATMVLGKKAYAISNNGRIYTNDNIDLLLYERHVSSKQRRSGVRICSIRKRSKEDDDRFRANFTKLCRIALHL
ncbi:hypothetical protein lbkm_2974 [Lachnospiraceae bacterium KM106-2]|nr:hypothetical protein lbkm_2974 [Lachnospiraceae bacterium KM106-2]